MPKALQHTYPTWQSDPHAEDCGVDAGRRIWPGVPRFVSAKRARKLRKRGVPLMPCHAVFDAAERLQQYGHRYEPLTPGAPGKKTARYCWFERDTEHEARKLVKLLRGRIRSLRGLPLRIENLLSATYGIERRRGAPYTFEVVNEVTEANRAVRMSPLVRVTYTIVAPENPNGLTYDMSKAQLLRTLDEDVEIEIPSGPPHVDCDCMACRPWTT